MTAASTASLLSSEVLDQLVARVADEVTKRLSPAESPSGPPVVSNSAASPSSNLAELPLVSPHVWQPPVASAIAPGAVPTSSEDHSTDTSPQQLPGIPPVPTMVLANAMVQHSIATAQSSLAGASTSQAPSLPSKLFTSPSLPIDARVSNKLRAKIWNNEYFEFGALLGHLLFPPWGWPMSWSSILLLRHSLLWQVSQPPKLPLCPVNFLL